MQKRNQILFVFVMACGAFAAAQQSPDRQPSGARAEGPCDIYGATGTPCVAAHSTTRSLYASYKGPLYQVKRKSDGKTLDIGVVSATATGGGYANAAAQDTFCTNTLCVISLIYDQSGKGNHLLQAAPGTFKGSARGAFDTLPIADMAPITISGHKAYGVYIIPGMGFRNNDATGIAVNDEPEGIYYVIDGTHFDSGCCFDYGNSSTNGRAVGTGTMETTYFGTSTVWGHGNRSGPWIMSDMEAGLFSGHGAKENPGDPTVDAWRFVTAVMDGGGGDRWDLRGGDAQKGKLTTFYSGVRPNPSRSGGYYPMHKKGGILLGTGGDNGNGSSGTFYEGVMTSGYPTEATTDAVQANIVAAHYDVQRVSLSRVTTFTQGSTQEVSVTFTNTTGRPVAGVKLALDLPNMQWTSVGMGAPDSEKSFDSVAPGARVSRTFKVTSPVASGAGFLTAKAEWTDSVSNVRASETITSRLRNAPPVKINEVRFGTSTNGTNQFIELYNLSRKAVDLSNWTLVHTPSQWSSVKLATIPPGTKLGSRAYYLLGLSTTGLAAPADVGEKTIFVRSTEGLVVGQKTDIDGETRTIEKLGSAAEALTTVFIPVSTGPWLTIPAGSTNLPVTSAAGFVVGQKMSIEDRGNYELATVTAVGKASTQTTLVSAATTGVLVIKLAAVSNLSVGDMITVGTGALKETVKVASVGKQEMAGADVTLASPLRFDHMADVDVAGPGTGIDFSPATRSPHTSGEAVQALGSGIVLDRPLSYSHPWGASVQCTQAPGVGYEGSPSPNQWFGASLSNPTVVPNPAGLLANNAGSIALMDATGHVVVDAMVYGTQQTNSSGAGTITSPELATLEGDQGKGGCIAIAPGVVSGEGTSIGRFPDGADTDSNCSDFVSQAAAILTAASTAGTDNIKISSVSGFKAGQTIAIGAGPTQESAEIAVVGTAGATKVATATDAGVKVIPVATALGFSPGQVITIGSGSDVETATIATIARRGPPSITVAAGLTHPLPAGTSISGSGLTLTTKLKQSHADGVPVATHTPTPGAANRY